MHNLTRFTAMAFILAPATIFCEGKADTCLDFKARLGTSSAKVITEFSGEASAPRCVLISGKKEPPELVAMTHFNSRSDASKMLSEIGNLDYHEAKEFGSYYTKDRARWIKEQRYETCTLYVLSEDLLLQLSWSLNGTTKGTPQSQCRIEHLPSSQRVQLEAFKGATAEESFSPHKNVRQCIEQRTLLNIPEAAIQLKNQKRAPASNPLCSLSRRQQFSGIDVLNFRGPDNAAAYIHEALEPLERKNEVWRVKDFYLYSEDRVSSNKHYRLCSLVAHRKSTVVNIVWTLQIIPGQTDSSQCKLENIPDDEFRHLESLL